MKGETREEEKNTVYIFRVILTDLSLILDFAIPSNRFDGQVFLGT